MAATKVANKIYNELKNIDADAALSKARDAVADMCRIEFNRIDKPLTLKKFFKQHVRKMVKGCNLECTCRYVDRRYFEIDHIIIYTEINDEIELVYDFDVILYEPIKLLSTNNIPKATVRVRFIVDEDGSYDID